MSTAAGWVNNRPCRWERGLQAPLPPLSQSEAQDRAPRLPGDSHGRDQSRDSYKDARCWVRCGGRFWLAARSPFSRGDHRLKGDPCAQWAGRGALAWGRGHAVSARLSSCPSGDGCFVSGVQGRLRLPSVFQESLRVLCFCYLLFSGGGVKSGTTCAAIWMTSLLLLHWRIANV